ncbi:hypothetical protein N0V93_003680 [Gnomoniopsis smithogilvyi]|uniref:High affinity methionine permease n=1 Tax=Gnomoniopsis smithogilvyi TaxID=1191159 RepID=A0A9W8Z0X0_9PEZI|nr:hypothetical protein N0V93_003680 [Gnomoniopsis smithogilvyi]
MSSWRRPFRSSQIEAVEAVDSRPDSEISDGSLKYTGHRGGNNAAPTYQEASGAPVEAESPMGYSVSALTIMFLNINMMIGTGIFSTREFHGYIETTNTVSRASTYNSKSVFYSFWNWFHWAKPNLLDTFSYHLSNAIGLVKVALLLFIIITGFVVLGGGTRVKDPKANFRNSFEGTANASAYGLTNALYRIIFSYGGYNNAFNVVNEIKNPVKSLKRNAALALFIVYVLYMLTNISWYAGVSKYDLENSKLTTASLWFSNVLGSSTRVRGLNFLIALSAFGNMVSGSIGAARMIRECGRQGVLPWTNFWASTRPFGTPIGPYLFKWAITALIILAIPSGDAFNFIADLAILPSAAFNLAMAVGLYLVRWRRKRANLPEPEFKAWNILVIFNVLVQAYLVIMPWYPPVGGKGDVSFWYGTYCVTGVAILIVCGIYYLVWAKLLPKWKGYTLRQEVVDLGQGAEAHRIAKVPNAQLADWDAEHDAVGHLQHRVIQEWGSEGEKGTSTSSKPDSKKAIVVESAASLV